MAVDLDIIKAVFEHRLHQDDLEPILASLSDSAQEELLDKIGDILQRISALVEVSNRVADSLSLDELLPRLMEVITDALTSERSTLFLHDDEDNTLFSRVALGDGVGEIRIPDNAGIAGAIFHAGKPELIPDAYADPRFNQEVDKKTGFRTRNILCAPVRNKKRKIIGVTQVLNKTVGDYDKDDLILLEALTSQAASALENAKLFESVERQRREESRMLEITTAISTELQLDALLARIIGVTTELLGADRSSLFLFDPKTDELWTRVAEGMGTKEIRIPSFAGIAGACFTSGEVINIPEAYDDPRFNKEVDKKTGYRTKTILCMPIRNKEGDKLGVVQVLNKHKGEFTPYDEKRLAAFTAQAAIALENAQLFEDVLNERNYNESILKSLSNGVVTLNADRKVEKVNEAALKIFGWMGEGEVLEKTDAEAFTEANQWLIDSVTKVATEGLIDVAVDTDVTRPDGTANSVNLTSVPLIDISGENIGYMLVLEDISREKRVKSTMSRYMPKEVVDQVMADEEGMLGGQEQLVSILFSDIRSFTTISEALGAKGTVEMLNEYFTDMVDAIFSHHGILDKYIGDAIMALFGAPLPTGRDADNAVLVAEEMMKRLRQLNVKRVAAGQKAMDIGVGLATGTVIAGNIGSPKRMDYTAIGDSVNLASRLEGANKAYGTRILMDDRTVKASSQSHKAREIDLIRVKGKMVPVAVYEGLGYHTPETFPNMDDCVAAFAQGLILYRTQDWDGAISAFEEALEANPQDKPSSIYLERCKHLREEPPPEDWDGVFVMTTK